jgi:purine-binding chemotaxis protein CheW
MGTASEGVAERDEAFMLDDEDGDGMADKYLSFRLGGESYGLPIRCVTEIIELPRISPVPDMPAWIKGFMNLRGAVIPVMDLRRRLGMEERAFDDRTCVVVTEVSRPGGGALAVGLVVDTVEEVVEIPERDVEQVPRLRSASDEGGYLMGIGKIGDRVKILLDIGKVIGEGAEGGDNA